MADRRGLVRVVGRSTSERGYGSVHRRLRARWAPKVAAGAVRCRRCRELIEPGEAWHLGHDDYDRSLPAVPEHADCNVRGVPRLPVAKHSREW